ncbi:hypothetical protein Tcan_09395 [Toxocara canis]|uniref:Uncharacterized protein n=1 Tax=Toxocara canis TaxID=6265 RepID=A0A0B2USH0_TOXCA|nr:hypothetical protein Tcan_09395 [Toxocara canis]
MKGTVIQTFGEDVASEGKQKRWNSSGTLMAKDEGHGGEEPAISFSINSEQSIQSRSELQSAKGERKRRIMDNVHTIGINIYDSESAISLNSS